MSEEKRKVKSRKRHFSKMMRWLHTEGRRYCAIALCASLILGNIGQMAAAADGDPDKEFELDRVALYEAVQEAVLGDPVEESSFSFTGDAADTYVRAMFEDGAPLYELKPEIEDNKGNLKLCIFAKLDGDVILDDDVSAESGATQLYEIDGSEEFYFLLTNTSTQEQTAVIRVGEKETGLITVVPNSAVVKSEPEGRVATENLVDAAPMEKAGSGGGNGSGSGTTVSKTENETVQETTEAVAEVTQPVETETEKETQIAEENKATDETSGALEETNAAETEEVKESEAVSESEASKENDAVQESDSAEEFGADQSGTDRSDVNEGENQAEVSENPADNSAAEGNISDSASEGVSDTSSEDTGTEISIDNDTSSVEDFGNETVVSVIGEAAGISLHKTYRVATAKATASNATPSDAEEELASDSNATDSNAAKDVLDGQVWEAVSLDDASAVVFATTAEDIQVSNDLEKFASPSDAGHLYQASVDDLGITVQVYAKENSFSEKVDLSVTELKADDNETSEDFQKAKAALDDSGLEYTNMIALDVSFISRATGEEVEPENGKVQVYFELDASLVAEDAIETLAVHHLEEKGGDIVNVETVADNANGELADLLENENGELIATEFAVDSFSSFTVTWWERLQGNGKTTVNFYVNLNSTMADSELGSTGGKVEDKFTSAVWETGFNNIPSKFVSDSTTGWYEVISGSSDGSAYGIDKEIRLLKDGYSTSDYIGEFKLTSFPTDEEIFQKLRNNWNTYVTSNLIQVGETPITSNNKEDLTSDNYAIRWYVFKYSPYDVWHIDGILVPKYGRLSVSKTIENATDKVLTSVEKNFAIHVNSGALDNSSSKQSYKLILDTDATTNQGIRLYDSKDVSKDGNSVTYTWEIDVLDRKYTISESGADVANWTYSATYSKNVNKASKDTSVTNQNLHESFTIDCVVVADDTNDDGSQSVLLTNTYTKASGDLKITKAVAGVSVDTVQDKTFEFEVKADTSAGTLDLVDGTTYTVNNAEYTVSNNALRVTMTGTGSVTIKNLPLGTYTVSEVVDGNDLDLSEYYYAGNDGKKSVSVTGNATVGATITNTYKPWLKVTVKKRVTGNMGDRSAEFAFQPTITRGGKDVTSQVCSGLNNAGQFVLKDCTANNDMKYTISNLKKGDVVTINEVDVESGYDTTIEFDGTANTSQADREYSSGYGLTTDTVVFFINEKNVNTPTGLFTTKIPYMLMLAVAVLGIFGFTVTDFKKHALKKREDD